MAGLVCCGQTRSAATAAPTAEKNKIATATAATLSAAIAERFGSMVLMQSPAELQRTLMARALPATPLLHHS
jgi:hypothetical protein